MFFLKVPALLDMRRMKIISVSVVNEVTIRAITTASTANPVLMELQPSMRGPPANTTAH